MDSEKLKTKYDEKAAINERLRVEAEFTLKQILEKRSIKTHEISSRVKTFESFLKKAKNKESKEPFEEIQDIVGLRVVCLFLSDIPKIVESIRESFDILSEDDKIKEKDASSLGYLSVHFTVRLSEKCSGPRYDEIVGIPFEIQVRTIAMHAWAIISHYLSYKTKLDVPNELQRDFYALSGLFYIADVHFEMFFKSVMESRKRMDTVFQGGTLKVDSDINLDSMMAYLHRKFPDRRHANSDIVSELIQELSAAGYKSINDIENAIDIAWDTFLDKEKTHPPSDCDDGKFMDVGVIRCIFDIFDNNFQAIRTKLYHNRQVR